MYKGKKVSVAFPAYNEADNIAQAVKDFSARPEVDEVIVVDNNSKDETALRATRAGATVINETKQGYGNACQRGMREASGDLIVLCEPDGTFTAQDIEKLLPFTDEFDLVLGTRTTKELIRPEANMGYFLRWGNWSLAKLIEVLFLGPSLSDVGCTFRVIRRPALKQIQAQFQVGGSSFSPEMMVLALTNGLRVVEVPVNYHKRTGESKITGEMHKAFSLGLVMIALILKMRLRS